MTLNIIYLLYQVWPYTIFGAHQLKKVGEISNENQFKLLIFNVYQDNRDVKSCLLTIVENHPDIILLVETDQWWKQELDKKLLHQYQYTVAQPLPNTYGMLLYSKFKLDDAKVKFLVEKDIPSIHTKVELRSGKRFRLFCLHPTPPVPNENPRSTERDAEILKVAKEAKSLSEPVVVAGDLNDVAWSYTTELFLKVSHLLDPRRGRGFFNTFNAHYWFLRWPLDHVFCSTHFHLVSLKRLHAIGSDHFPILIELALVEAIASENREQILETTDHEEEVAEQKIQKA